MWPKLLIPLALGAAAAFGLLLPAAAAGPPLLTPVVPDTAQEQLQAQLAIEQAQARARLAAAQAQLQARLDANQAGLAGQLAARQAGTQAQLDAARQRRIMAGGLSLPMICAMQEPLRAPAGTMQLITLTPRLGRYFGTSHGVLVARAPAHGALKLQDGDVILSIGGRIPASSSQAIRILTSYDPGEQIKLVILRERHRINITATMPASAAVP